MSTHGVKVKELKLEGLCIYIEYRDALKVLIS